MSYNRIEGNKLMARRINEISKDILQTLAVVGIFTIAATSPYFLINLAKGFQKQNKYLKKKYTQLKITRALDLLRRSRMVILREEGNKFIVELTEKGKRKVKEIEVEDLKIKKPKTWDKIWRVIIFDIPEERKDGRNALRSKFRELGFYQLQKSVWVFPYPCEKEIELLVELFDIYPFVNIIEAKRIKDDVKLKAYFNLL